MTVADFLIQGMPGQLLALGGLLVTGVLLPVIGVLVLVHFLATAVEAA